MANNTEVGSELHKIVSEYYAGYLYRNVKTHKSNVLLHHNFTNPHTSINNNPKPTNSVILTSKYRINSMGEFFNILQTNKPNNCILASLNI